MHSLSCSCICIFLSNVDTHTYTIIQLRLWALSTATTTRGCPNHFPRLSYTASLCFAFSIVPHARLSGKSQGLTNAPTPSAAGPSVAFRCRYSGYCYPHVPAAFHRSVPSVLYNRNAHHDARVCYLTCWTTWFSPGRPIVYICAMLPVKCWLTITFTGGNTLAQTATCLFSSVSPASKKASTSSIAWSLSSKGSSSSSSSSSLA